MVRKKRLRKVSYGELLFVFMAFAQIVGGCVCTISQALL